MSLKLFASLSLYCSLTAEELIFSLCRCTAAEKDEDTTLKLLGNASDFVAVYGKPLYMIENMTGKPTNLLRLSYSAVKTDADGMSDDHFSDDFFQHNSNNVGFQQLLENYTFVLHYTGLRWYGK